MARDAAIVRGGTDSRKSTPSQAAKRPIRGPELSALAHCLFFLLGVGATRHMPGDDYSRALAERIAAERGWTRPWLREVA